MTRFGLIVAVDESFGFAKNETIPWNCPEDLKYFKSMTLKSTVIMGKKTYDSIGMLLPNRNNIVVSSNKDDSIETVSLESLPKALENVAFAWVIGGIQLIEHFLANYSFDVISISKIKGSYDCDKFLTILSNPTFGLHSVDVKMSEMLTVSYFYQSSELNVYDFSYLQTMKKILKSQPRQTRNALTRSFFGETIRFDNILENGFPILGSKKIYWHGIVEELLFFLSGQTNTKELENRKVNIWKGNTSEEFLSSNGKEYQEGDMGPMYGFQLKHYGEKYLGFLDSYQGIDQIRNVVNLLVNDPYSRRILMTTYNVSQAEEGVLYPCHGLITQFYRDNNKISLITYQRSADWFLGVPFNITSYALLLTIIVREVNKHGSAYIPGDLIFNFGDVHLYEDHLPSVLKQLSVQPAMNKNCRVVINDSFDLYDPWKSTSEDFQLIDYTPGPVISAKMIA